MLEDRAEPMSCRGARRAWHRTDRQVLLDARSSGCACCRSSSRACGRAIRCPTSPCPTPTACMVIERGAARPRSPGARASSAGPGAPTARSPCRRSRRLRPAIEQLGASLVAISPMGADELRALAAERGLGLRLLSDPGAAYARFCGVQYEMTEGHIDALPAPGLGGGAGSMRVRLGAAGPRDLRRRPRRRDPLRLRRCRLEHGGRSRRTSSPPSQRLAQAAETAG